MAAGGGQQAGVGQGMYQSGWRSMAEEVRRAVSPLWIQAQRDELVRHWKNEEGFWF